MRALLSQLALRCRRRPSWQPRWPTRCARGAGRARRYSVGRRALTLQPPCNPPQPPLHLNPVPSAPPYTLCTPCTPLTPFTAPLHLPCTHPAPTLHPAPRRAALCRSGCSSSCRTRPRSGRGPRCSRAREGRTWRRFAANRSATRSARSLRWRTRRCGMRWRRSTSRAAHSRCAGKRMPRRCCATNHRSNVAPAPALILTASQHPKPKPDGGLEPLPTPPTLTSHFHHRPRPHLRPHLCQVRRGGARVCTRRTEPHAH